MLLRRVTPWYTDHVELQQHNNAPTCCPGNGISEQALHGHHTSSVFVQPNNQVSCLSMICLSMIINEAQGAARSYQLTLLYIRFPNAVALFISDLIP